MRICEYGCGREAKFQMKNGKFCCSKWYASCPSFINKVKEIENRGKFKKGQKIHSKEEKEKRKQRMLNGLAKYIRSKRGPVTEKEKEEKRKMMLDGQAAWMNKFQQNPSKEELKLREICQKLLPYIELGYPVFRVGKGKRSYNIDIAIPKLELAIEFDGYFHFCDQEHIEYHNRRQKEIEEDGWKFLRYNIFQKFPTLEQVKEDIQRIIT